MDQIPSKPPASRSFKMVGKQSMDAILDQAVSSALGSEIGDLEREKLRALQDKVRANFQGLLRQNARTVKGVSKSRFLAEVDASRKEILNKRAQAEAEMGELQRRAAMLRNLFLVGGAGMDAGGSSGSQLEAQLEARFRMMSLEAGPAMRREGFPAELARSGAALARAEWNRILDEHASQASDEIDLYRRRIEKLSGALVQTEEALEAMSKLKDGDPGMASIYRNVRGLKGDSLQSMQKLAMLKVLFQNNVKLQSYR